MLSDVKKMSRQRYEQGRLVRRMARRVGSLLWGWTRQRERHTQNLERIW